MRMVRPFSVKQASYLNRHHSRLSRIKKHASHHFDVVFAGDSITHNWERDREKRAVYGQQVWNEAFRIS